MTARRPPIRTGAEYHTGQCGGVLETRRFTANLDRTPVTAVPVPGTDHDADGNEIKTPAVDFPYKISESDPEIFLVRAATRRCDCSWHLLLTWSQSGREATLKIDASGKDFRTTGTASLRHWWWTDGMKAWKRIAA
ncbi:hypothetical protein [Sphaerisporangium aureirubrum]|uniref:Uncharacterized protein n=1 Tax=Sphaerisporangium aureirubrum TaxID=1544736 RepID=A0ABW1NNH5_9ACTN